MNKLPILEQSLKRFVVYTLYINNNPKYPEYPYILLKHFTQANNTQPILDKDFIVLVKDLAILRQEITAQGFVCFTRSDEDDPAIIETYL